jgi:hypothetical protein
MLNWFMILVRGSPLTLLTLPGDFSGEELAKKLITSHNPSHCGWINDENQTPFRHNFSPESFLSFPSHTLDSRLLEFQARFLSWYQFLPSLSVQIQIPKELSQWTKLYTLINEPTSPLLLSLETLIKTKDKTSVISPTSLLGAFYCSLYCWDLSPSPSSSLQKPSSVLVASCSLCGRTFNCQISDPSFARNLSPINPSQEHKYYCPVVSSYHPPALLQQDTPSEVSSRDDVPAGSLQMIEAILTNSLNWKVCQFVSLALILFPQQTTEDILSDNPHRVPVAVFTINGQKLKRSFGENFLASTLLSEITPAGEGLGGETIDQKYKKIKSVLAMVPSRQSTSQLG